MHSSTHVCVFMCECTHAPQQYALSSVLCCIHFPSNLSNISRAKPQNKSSFVKEKGLFFHSSILPKMVQELMITA